MPVQFLLPKLTPPYFKTGAVSREKICKELSRGLDRKITVVAAPAGFGKSLAVREWLDTDKSFSAAWLNLDANDNDPAEFLSYLIRALQIVYPELAPGLLDSIRSPQPAPFESVYLSLFNQLAGMESKTVIVLDDYHHITDLRIHEILSSIIDYLPMKVQMVLITREDPPLMLSRLRVQNELNEIGVSELRLTEDETGTFIRHTAGLPLDEAETSLLHEKTEGWIAGLHLAALAMEKTIDTEDKAAVDSFIQSFSGKNKFILDYLLEEVLLGLPDRIRTFMLQTSILRQFNASLCAAVCIFPEERKLEPGEIQQMLQDLENRNIFLMPLDQEQVWFRYHNLLGDILLQRLKQQSQELMHRLQRRAADWYSEHGNYEYAINHAFEAQDYRLASELTVANLDNLWNSGAHPQLNSWIGRIPDDIIQNFPELRVMKILYLSVGGRDQDSEKALKEFEETLEKTEMTNPRDTESRKLRGRLAVIKTIIDSYRQNIPGILHNAAQALELLPEADGKWRSIASFALGDTNGFSGDMNITFRNRLDAVDICSSYGNQHLLLSAYIKLAITAREMGMLHRVLKICRERMQAADEAGLTSVLPYGCILAIYAETLSEIGEREQADIYIKKALLIVEPGGDMYLKGWSYLCYIRILYNRGDFTAARKIIQQLEEIKQSARLPEWISQSGLLWKQRLQLDKEDIEEVQVHLESSGVLSEGVIAAPESFNLQSMPRYVLNARYLKAAGEYRSAIELLQRIRRDAEENGRNAIVLEAMIIETTILWQTAEKEKSAESLSEALMLAEPEGFISAFSSEGKIMAEMLMEQISRNSSPDYASRILKAFPEEDNSRNNQTPVTGNNTLIEPLSRREIEVLQTIAMGFSNQEVADRLFVSLNTIKVHTRSIYSKLDVNSRLQAIAKAKSFGIIQP